MQFSASKPIYLQVMEDMKREMVTGDLPAGSRVESVRVLAGRYGINLNTMQRACSELEREGLLETRRGVGSFVTGDWERLAALREEMARSLAEAYLRGMAGLGFSRLEAEERLRGEERDDGEAVGSRRAL
ncbi:GntR family transcriptional regulator [uncultured Intestinimonas sp.]|uniref:GntR family transcriptional regulator n=1 Tax=uncultured Intestinimonas sp. TaxID=1689265 RepID=UPI0026125015|nr:GntR family transcriptional regulator [uncultured Intestinimonas sp.]